MVINLKSMEGTCGRFSNANFWCVDRKISHSVINNLDVTWRVPNNKMEECMKVHAMTILILNIEMHVYSCVKYLYLNFTISIYVLSRQSKTSTHICKYTPWSKANHTYISSWKS